MFDGVVNLPSLFAPERSQASLYSGSLIRLRYSICFPVVWCGTASPKCSGMASCDLCVNSWVYMVFLVGRQLVLGQSMFAGSIRGFQYIGGALAWLLVGVVAAVVAVGATVVVSAGVGSVIAVCRSVLKYSLSSCDAWLAAVPVLRKGLGGWDGRWSSCMRSRTAVMVRSVFDVAGRGMLVDVKTTVSQGIVARVRGM